MAIFKLTAPEIGVTVFVRGKCISCARNLAADDAGEEGPAVWLNGARSTIEVVRPDDRSGVLMRSKNVE